MALSDGQGGPLPHSAQWGQKRYQLAFQLSNSKKILMSSVCRPSVELCWLEQQSSQPCYWYQLPFLQVRDVNRYFSHISTTLLHYEEYLIVQGFNLQCFFLNTKNIIFFWLGRVLSQEFFISFTKEFCSELVLFAQKKCLVSKILGFLFISLNSVLSSLLFIRSKL